MNETRQDRGIFPRYRLEVNMRAAGRFGTARIYDDELCLLAKHRFELLPGILSEILLGNDRIASHEQENIPGRRMHSPPVPFAVQSAGDDHSGLVDGHGADQIGRASCRDRVWQYV